MSFSPYEWSTMSQDKVASFVFHQCRNWKSIEDVVMVLQAFITHMHLIPLENGLVETSGGYRAFPIAADITDVVKRNYRYRADWTPELFRQYIPQEKLRVRLRTTFMSEWNVYEPYHGAVELLFIAERFGDIYTNIRMECFLDGARMLQIHPITTQWHEKILHLYRCGVDLGVDLLHPDYAYITEQDHRTEDRSVLRHKLLYIHWWNYFGPIYLTVYGTPVFLNAPGWKSTPLGEGIAYQRSANFVPGCDDILRQHIQYLRQN